MSEEGEIELSIAERLHRLKSIHYWDIIPDLTRAEARMLIDIAENSDEDSKISDMCVRLKMQPAAASRLMNSLEHKGLIERSSRLGNRRVTDVILTEAGRQRAGAIREVLREYWRTVLNSIPQEKVLILFDIADEVMDGMERVLAERLIT